MIKIAKERQTYENAEWQLGKKAPRKYGMLKELGRKINGFLTTGRAPRASTTIAR
jgi:hypothetical protein